jgi:Tfp pilus assembly protein PilO
MDETAKPKSPKFKKILTDLAYSPMKLRVVLSVLLLGAWYVALEMPRASEIDATTRRLDLERERLATAKEVEQLRRQVSRFDERIPKTSDPNEWVQYMLSGTRQCGLKVESLDTNGSKPAGPYRAVVAKITVVGTFQEVELFLRWVESNDRLLRIDALSYAPSSDTKTSADALHVTLVVLGLAT